MWFTGTPRSPTMVTSTVTTTYASMAASSTTTPPTPMATRRAPARGRAVLIRSLDRGDDRERLAEVGVRERRVDAVALLAAHLLLAARLGALGGQQELDEPAVRVEHGRGVIDPGHLRQRLLLPAAGEALEVHVLAEHDEVQLVRHAELGHLDRPLGVTVLQQARVHALDVDLGIAARAQCEAEARGVPQDVRRLLQQLCAGRVLGRGAAAAAAAGGGGGGRGRGRGQA